jgi:hypothetical protein
VFAAWSYVVDDFDTGQSQIAGSVPAVEVMQMGPQVDSVTVPAHTELQVMSHDEFLDDLSADARAIAYTMPSQWNQSFLAATAFGVGEDKCAGHGFEPTTKCTPCLHSRGLQFL